MAEVICKSEGGESPAVADVTPQFHVPTKEELLAGEVKLTEVEVCFPTGEKFILRKLTDITDFREIADQAELLTKATIKDAEGHEFFLKADLAHRLVMLSFSLVDPKLTPKELLEIGRKRGPMISRLSLEALVLNGFSDEEVEVRKND
jgi:hypothetical protein